jgi:hypothetical protein
MVSPIPRQGDPTMTVRTDRLAAPLPFARAASLPPAGLLALGLTVLPFSLHHAGLFPLGAALLGMAFFYGGLVQIAAGLYEWRRGNAFGSVVCTAFGLFWLSLIALAALPEAGFARAPRTQNMASYLLLWGAFAAVLGNGARALGREVTVCLTLLAGFFLLLAAGLFAGNPVLLAVAGCTGVACGFSALYAGVIRFIGEACGRSDAD